RDLILLVWPAQILVRTEVIGVWYDAGGRKGSSGSTFQEGRIVGLGVVPAALERRSVRRAGYPQRIDAVRPSYRLQEVEVGDVPVHVRILETGRITGQVRRSRAARNAPIFLLIAGCRESLEPVLGAIKLPVCRHLGRLPIDQDPV